jgi:hypothetical protein
MVTVETHPIDVTVKCLACGSTYAKPNGRGTVKTNPGCPECGYLGWTPLAEAFSGGGARRRFGADPRRPRSSQSR